MPHKNYLKGVRKERKIVNSNRQNGCIAFRSAGSHSPIDVCVINLKLKSIRFYQCKPNTMSENKKNKLEDELKELNDYFKVCFHVV